MKLDEFKAWFEGFTESMDSTPNEKQWARIKARVKEIDGVAVTERVYIDRYWPTYVPPTYVPAPAFVPAPLRPIWYSANTAGGGAGGITGITSGSGGGSFNSMNVMAALGRAEAAN